MDIRAGIRRLQHLRDELEDGSAIQEPYLEALRSQARRKASGRPTPQARSVSSALVVRDGALVVPGGAAITPRGGGLVSAGDLAGGSEFGSSIYPQFGPRRSRPGAWVGSSAANPDSASLAAGERGLESLVREAAR